MVINTLKTNLFPYQLLKHKHPNRQNKFKFIRQPSSLLLLEAVVRRCLYRSLSFNKVSGLMRYPMNFEKF